MILRKNQEQAFNNIAKYGKAFIFWGRQTGKSFLLSSIIQSYAANKKGTDILFFIKNKTYIKIAQDKVLKDIKNSIRSSKPSEIVLINNNYLTFCSIKEEYDYYLQHLNPSLIIFDDYDIADFYKFNNLTYYILKNNCKCIFTSSKIDKIDLKIVKLLDYNNDYYINIMSNDYEYPISFVDKDKLIITPDILKELSYKPDELIDYDDIIFKRRKKLKQLKLLSENGS